VREEPEMTKRQRDDQIRQTAQHFDRQAAGYDGSHTVRRFQSRAQALAISNVDVHSEMSILDLGCGTGSGALAIASQIEGPCKIVGIDPSPRMIREAETKRRRLGATSVSFAIGSAEDMTASSEFDLIVCTNAFHHFLNKEEVFRRVHRALRPGGRFVVEDICDDAWMMRTLDWFGRIGERAHVGSARSSALRSLLAGAGFAEIDVDIVRLTWFWRIMIGNGRRLDA